MDPFSSGAGHTQESRRGSRSTGERTGSCESLDGAGDPVAVAGQHRATQGFREQLLGLGNTTRREDDVSQAPQGKRPAEGLAGTIVKVEALSQHLGCSPQIAAASPQDVAAGDADQ